MKTPYYFLTLSIFLILACSLTTPPAVSNLDAQSVQKNYLATPTLIPTATFHTIPAAACTVTAETLHLRKCAGLQCTVIDWLSKDEVLVIHEKDHEWLQVTTPTGKTGWVHSKYCGGRQ